VQCNIKAEAAVLPTALLAAISAGNAAADGIIIAALSLAFLCLFITTTASAAVDSWTRQFLLHDIHLHPSQTYMPCHPAL
jgi:hypothetical protein